MDFIDGRQVPPRIVDHDEVVTGEHHGTIQVRGGAALHLLGQQHGTLTLESGSHALIEGEVHGTLSLAPQTSVVIRGEQHGTVHVSHGATLDVEGGARLAGSLHVDGLLRNRGTRGGAVSGTGAIEDLPGSVVKQPLIRNGMHIYQW